MSQKRFPEEFKIEAVRQIVERGHPVAEVSARLGVRTPSLYKRMKAKVSSRSGSIHTEATTLHPSGIMKTLSLCYFISL